MQVLTEPVTAAVSSPNFHAAAMDGVAVKAQDTFGAEMFKQMVVALKPIYDAVVTLVGSFGSDVEIAPKKNYVSLRSEKQFALVKTQGDSTFASFGGGWTLLARPPARATRTAP